MRSPRGVRGPGVRGVVPVAVVVALVTVLVSACSTVPGSGSPGTYAPAPDAELAVVNDGHTTFDQLVKNSISDVERFWQQSYPAVSNGKKYAPLKGALYSVDGANVTAEVKKNACLGRQPQGVVNNAFYCRLDDSVAWDRSPQHLLPVLGGNYGDFLTAMVFAHEFGHAIQERLGVFDTKLATIDTESQADCAAGAFVGWVIQGKARHTRVTPPALDSALVGYLQVRDPPPVSSAQISHGNGFDRLSAVQDGITKGPQFCYSPSYFDRRYTERPYTSDTDYLRGGNEPLQLVLDAGAKGGGLQPSLNAYWRTKATSIGKTWRDVKIAPADHPKCGASSATSQFAYCPDDNTVYYSRQAAEAAYNSVAALQVDRSTGAVQINAHQPGDYALGTLFVYGWGLAVRHQLFNRSLGDQSALVAATCYAGAYSASINVGNVTGFALSPADMDEATSTVLTVVPMDTVFGPRETTALQRIQYFTKGYFGGLRSC